MKRNRRIKRFIATKILRQKLLNLAEEIVREMVDRLNPQSPVRCMLSDNRDSATLGYLRSMSSKLFN